LRDKYTQKGKDLSDYIEQEKKLLLQKVLDGKMTEQEYQNALEEI
jgi:hypothetical protein